MDDMVEWAVKYHKEYDFNVFPVYGKDKPMTEFSNWFEKKQTEEDIRELWKPHPKANIAIMTGKINGITVIDLDLYKLDDKQKEELNKLLPEVFTPTVISPSNGVHRYFKYHPDIPNKSDILQAVDTRNDGGYIIAPPSMNGSGTKYVWHKKANIKDTVFRSLNNTYINSLLLYNNYNTIYTNRGKAQAPTDINRHQLTSTDNKVKEHARDETIFHVGHCLERGGMPIGEIYEILRLIGIHGCVEPFPKKEIDAKINSIMKRKKSRSRAWQEEIEDLLVTSSGVVTTSIVFNWLQVTSRDEKKAVALAMRRLADKGLLKKSSTVAGQYRIVSKDSTIRDWKNAKTETIDFNLPLGMGEAIRVRPGSIILFAGVTNSGKSAFSM